MTQAPKLQTLAVVPPTPRGRQSLAEATGALIGGTFGQPGRAQVANGMFCYKTGSNSGRNHRMAWGDSKSLRSTHCSRAITLALAQTLTGGLKKKNGTELNDSKD
ncbi:hypothetical protein PoB_004889900 [Plakobranchus ocellatus]|uniref:Uncharacterized protein n=1 Tax=Plakobranchus ocellatus TaxID=259542 RepID=A0AAV4BVF6_9GAST|nr:hypothetical protein PoB_004889900 [Plakobranchus ocellatus]